MLNSNSNSNSTNITWRNHYIPQFILQNFENPINGLINIYDKDKSINQVIQQCGKNGTGYLEHLYTFEDINGIISDNLEKSFGSIESASAPIIKKLIYNNNIVINSKNIYYPLNISINENKQLINFLILQYIRVPKWFSLAAKVHQCDSYIDKNIVNSNEFIELPEETYYNDDILQYIFNKELIKNLKNHFNSYLFFIVKNPTSNFIIGDCGIATLGSLENFQNEIYFPISPRLCIMGVHLINITDLDDFFSKANNIKYDNYNLISDKINYSCIKNTSKYLFSYNPFSEIMKQDIASNSHSNIKFLNNTNIISPNIKHKPRWKKNKGSIL